MIRNSTLKGLALAAVASLAFAGISTLPASAVGLTGLVTLAPDVGTEYSVLANAGATFTLKANEASTAGNGNLKFLVTDPSGVVEPSISSTTEQHGLTATQTVSAAVAGGVKTLTVSLGGAPKMAVGDIISFTANLVVSASVVVATASPSTYVVKAVSGQTVAFDVTGNVPTFSPEVIVGTPTLKVLRSARSLANTFVVDSDVNSAAAVEQLVLGVSGDTSRTVTVTAFKDITEDNVLDASEQVSPTRTVNFVKASELTVTTTLAVVPGDTTLSAKIKTTPVLNGQLMILQNPDFLNAAMTRQDSAKVFYAPGDSNKTSTWDDTAKEFTVSVSLRSGANVVATTTSGGINADTDSGLAKPANQGATQTAAKTSGSAVITITTAGHNVRVGDFVTLGATGDAAFNVRYRVASVPATDKFTVNAATSSVAISTTTASYDVTTYTAAPTTQNALVDRAFAGEYSAQAIINDVLSGAKVVASAVSATSAAIEFSTVGTASVQGSSDGSAILVRNGTLTAPVTISVLDADEAAVSAGRPVVVSFTTGVAGVRVNDKTGAQTLTTDANGQVMLTVTSTAGANGFATISATAENSVTKTFQVQWIAQAFGLFDLAATGGEVSGAVTRVIVAGGSHTMDLGVMDQWYTAPASGEYRLVVTGAGTTNGIVAMTNGRASVVVTDNGFQAAMTTTITLQKLTSAVWADVANKSISLTTNVNKNTNSILLGANGSSLFASKTVRLSSPVALKAIVAADYRLTTAAKPAYSWSALVTGKVQNAGTSVGVSGAAVTITGPASVLFRDGSVDKIGSITVLSDSSGHFSADLFSTTAQKDTVVTVTSLGKSSTTKVTFTGLTSDGIGRTLVITAPDTVAPASTLQIKAKLTDSFGNAVVSPVRFTYTGPGIGFGNLPTTTDAMGELAYSVLLGAGDTGTISVVVSYDQNGDGDFVDAKDLNTTKTITVGTAAVAPVVPVADQKVNVGSFKGFVALYAKGYAGQRMSAIVAGRWIVVESLGSGFERVVRFTGAGFNIDVKIYIDRVLTGTFSVLTK